MILLGVFCDWSDEGWQTTALETPGDSKIQDDRWATNPF